MQVQDARRDRVDSRLDMGVDSAYGFAFNGAEVATEDVISRPRVARSHRAIVEMSDACIDELPRTGAHDYVFKLACPYRAFVSALGVIFRAAVYGIDGHGDVTVGNQVPYTVDGLVGLELI